MTPGRASVRMMLRSGVVFVFAFSALASVAQVSQRSIVVDSTGAAKPTVEDLLRSAQKQFRPEVWAVRADSFLVKPNRSYCVYRAVETRSLVFRPCPPANKVRLLPSLKPLPASPSK